MSATEENLLPEVSLIQGRIEEVSLGEPTVHGHMAIFPLLDKEESARDYLTLDESIANGYAHVTEINESGDVPELKFRNSSDKRIFLMEGEELVGAKQNRTLNLSILAPAEREITIPVTCVESGDGLITRNGLIPRIVFIIQEGAEKKWHRYLNP